MSTIELPLNGFVDYLRTRGAARVEVAHRHITQSVEPYSPARDFYRRILAAILAARRSGDDRTVLRHALAEAPPSRRDNYEAVVSGWLKFLPQLTDTENVPVNTGRWHGAGLTVRVTPHLAARYLDDRVEAIFLYFKADPLPRKDAAAMLWLAAAAMPQACPGAKPVILDVRRGKAYRDIPTGGDYPAWLGAEAGGYRQLRRRLNTVAAD
ncbi:hypothetical protein FB566_2490 [Stackebrandtia endophytica]|uniref:Uncharacterized protein n=1 Tax=Stackebrandtia endophytica TaxID=1496996 RepID=A0A543AWJ3_9ACTN|nr:hypothetical protein [Stackebrandtia endophytica]TQL76946.1 hypothetical protein FB566_2490 [Stackebrandtia endophytica]